MRRGYTLIEVLLALMILLTVAVSAFYMSFLSLRMAENVFWRFIVTKGVLEYKLESLRAASYSTLDPAAGWVNCLTTAPPAMVNPADTIMSPVAEPDETGRALLKLVTTCRYQVTWLHDPDLKQVLVEVRWTDPDGRANSLASASTVIGRSGLTDPGT